jgi:hypothetical protein
VRRLTLQVAGTDRLQESVLILAENVAKVAYNATQPIGPFDADTGWWLVPNLVSICTHVNDPALTARAWSLLSDGSRGRA